MNIGMMWEDDSKKRVKTKIQEAVDYFKEKYGITATVCIVNPKTLRLPGEITQKFGSTEIKLRTNKRVPTNYFWVGHE
jgi:hypothetical protein